jgi:hypothetical protein
MSEFEGQYTNIQGNSVENELAKIVMRYKNEAKPTDRYSMSDARGYRYDEGGREGITMQQEMVQGNRI